MIALTKHPNQTTHHDQGEEGKNDSAEPICLPWGAGGELLMDCCIIITVSIGFLETRKEATQAHDLAIPFPSRVAAILLTGLWWCHCHEQQG